MARKYTDDGDNQLVLGFTGEPVKLKPLHLLYLLAIYDGSFDIRVHKGHFCTHATIFGERVRELIEYGLIQYDGIHRMTPRGVSHVFSMLDQPIKVQP